MKEGGWWATVEDSGRKGLMRKATLKSSENSFLIPIAVKYEKFGMKEKTLYLY